MACSRRLNGAIANGAKFAMEERRKRNIIVTCGVVMCSETKVKVRPQIKAYIICRSSIQRRSAVFLSEDFINRFKGLHKRKHN